MELMDDTLIFIVSELFQQQISQLPLMKMIILQVQERIQMR
jgi:hypothetical protein